MNSLKVRLRTIITRAPIPLSLFILTTVIAGSFAVIGVDPHHDGIMFVPALSVARGSMLFRDTFTQYGALTTLFQAWALMILGKYLLTIQLLTAFFYGLISVLLYVIYQRILPKSLSIITIVLWIFTAPYFLVLFLPWASVYALFFQLLGTYTLIKYEERAKNWYLCWTGVATAATFFTRQPGGVFMLAAIYAYLLCTFITRNASFSKFIRSVYLFTCGVAMTTAVFLIWIAAHGAFRDFWLQSIRFAYNFGANRPDATFTGIVAALFPGGWRTISLWSLFPVATILVSLAYLIALLRKKHVLHAKTVLIIAAIGLSAWLQYYPVTDDRHLYWGATQMFGLLTLIILSALGYILHFLPKFGRQIAFGLTCIALAGLFAPLVIPRVTGGIDKLRQPYVTANKPEILRGMLLPASEAQFYASVARNMDTYFKDNPHGNVVNLSRDGLYMAFDPRIRNTTPLYINWYELYAVYPEFPYEMRAYVTLHKPLAIGTNAIIPEGRYCPFVNSPAVSDIVLYEPCP